MQKINVDIGTNKRLGLEISIDKASNFKGRLCVPTDERIRNEMLEEVYSTRTHCTSQLYEKASRSSKYILIDNREKRNMSFCGEMYGLSVAQSETPKAIRTIETVRYSLMKMETHCNRFRGRSSVINKRS